MVEEIASQEGQGGKGKLTAIQSREPAQQRSNPGLEIFAEDAVDAIRQRIAQLKADPKNGEVRMSRAEFLGRPTPESETANKASFRDSMDHHVARFEKFIPKRHGGPSLISQIPHTPSELFHQIQRSSDLVNAIFDLFKRFH